MHRVLIYLIFLSFWPVFAHGPDDGILKKLTEEIAVTPENAKLYLKRALINERHQDWKACEEDLLKAQTLEVALTDFNYFLGRVAMGQAQNQKAIEYFDKSLQQKPKDFEILFAKGRAYFSLKKLIVKTSFYEKIIKFIDGLKEGFKSIKKMKRKSSFWFHTFSIWIMYFLMTYVCFFAIEETSNLTISDGLFLLVLGGIGMVIPTPGGIGSYHAIVMIGLSVLGVGKVYLGEDGDPANPALLFPAIVHAAQTLVAIIMGSVGMIYLFVNKKNKNHE